MLFLLLCLSLGGIPTQRPADVVKWSADAPAKPVAAGSMAQIALTARIAPGWKLYALTQPKGGPVPLNIAVAKGSPFEVDRQAIVAPKAKTQDDEQFSTKTQYHEGEATFTVPVGVGKTLAPGSHTVPLEVTFQACGERICLRPYTQRVEVGVVVGK